MQKQNKKLTWDQYDQLKPTRAKFDWKTLISM